MKNRSFKEKPVGFIESYKTTFHDHGKGYTYDSRDPLLKRKPASHAFYFTIYGEGWDEEHGHTSTDVMETAKRALIEVRRRDSLSCLVPPRSLPCRPVVPFMTPQSHRRWVKSVLTRN